MDSTIIDEVASILLELSLKETDTAIITSLAIAIAELDLLVGDQE